MRYGSGQGVVMANLMASSAANRHSEAGCGLKRLQSATLYVVLHHFGNDHLAEGY